MDNNKTKQAILIVDTDDVRLDRWLRRKLHVNQGAIEKHIRLGVVRVDGAKISSSTRVIKDQKVCIPPEWNDLLAKSPAKKLKPKLSEADQAFLTNMIIWEDDALLVLNKPHGLAIQGGSKTTRHLDDLLQQYGTKLGATYRLVHRLDRDTSGIVLVAKTSEMAAHLAETFRQGKVKKTYWAVVVGNPLGREGTIELPLIKTGEKNREKVVVDKLNGKQAITHYRVVKKIYPDLFLLELSPKTGRTHQLRVHCAHLGMPILGDGKYGGPAAMSANKVHLHARFVEFLDSQGQILNFTAPPSPHMKETLSHLR